MDLSAYIRRRADRYLPISEAGVTLYPIPVADLELFESTRPALEFMQQGNAIQLRKWDIRHYNIGLQSQRFRQRRAAISGAADDIDARAPRDGATHTRDELLIHIRYVKPALLHLLSSPVNNLWYI